VFNSFFFFFFTKKFFFFFFEKNYLFFPSVNLTTFANVLRGVGK
jgi:hypothetical protein